MSIRKFFHSWRSHALAGSLIRGAAVIANRKAEAMTTLLRYGIEREKRQHPGKLPSTWDEHIWREALAWAYGYDAPGMARLMVGDVSWDG